MQAAFRRRGWDRAIGSSGTVRAAGDIVQQLGLVETGVTRAALETVIATMAEAKRVEDLELPGLGAERAPVFAGGMAILSEVMSTLKIDKLEISSGALREGLLYDMLGRLHHQDARERSIQAMQRRYHVDTDQAQRVEATRGVIARAGEAELEARRRATIGSCSFGLRASMRWASTSRTRAITTTAAICSPMRTCRGSCASSRRSCRRS